MKASIFLTFIIFLSGCATSNITTVVNQPATNPYSKVLVLFSASDADFYQLDSATYVENIQPSFNNLDMVDFRNQLEKSFARNLGSEGSILIKSGDLYPVNSKISYTDFLQKIKDTNPDAILLVNLKGYWQTNTSATITQNTIQTNTSPNALYTCYLVDAKSGKPVWIAKSVVNGTSLSGYDTINNTLAHRVANKLTQKGYLYSQQ